LLLYIPDKHGAELLTQKVQHSAALGVAVPIKPIQKGHETTFKKIGPPNWTENR